ncbi:MAG: DUF1700 domain-containing protein [Lachnospiraceae bacterium]|nr:DUF1700 domain-containing protein [Lachnospiraceae bacterium]
MSRWEFMRRLESLLSDISPNEREEALQYYNDYFNDAGRENEQEVIRALGSPEQVAKIVKDGLADNLEAGEFTENGFSSRSAEQRNAIIKSPRQSGEANAQNGEAATQSGEANAQSRGIDAQSEGAIAQSEGIAQGGWNKSAGTGSAETQNAADRKSSAGNGEASSFSKESGNAAAGDAGRQKKKDEFPTWAIVLIVIGCVILSPVVLTLAGALLTVIVSVLATVFGLVFGFGLAALILFIVAVSLAAGGFGCVLSSPITALGLLGGGLICLSLGILFVLLTVLVAGKLIPAICQGIAYIFKKLFGKKEAAA